MCAIQITRSFWLIILLFLTVLHLVRSEDTETVTTIDDKDPAIRYSAGWESFPRESSYKGAATLSTFAGSSATLKFNGTRVSVFGLQRGTNGNITSSTYSIDNSSSSQYTVPLDQNATQYGIKFYSSPLLSEGSEHTLFIRNMKDHGWYWLDYIEVSSPAAIPPTSASSDKTSDLTPTPTAGNTQQSKAGISKGIIAGIALGVSAPIVLLLLAAFLWKRRHLKSTKVDSTADLLQPLEGDRHMHGSARLEPYQVERFTALSNIPTASNGLNEKRTYNGVAPISSTENSVDASHSLVNGHASDSATSQYTFERRDDTSEIPRSEPSMPRPMSLSKLRPPYRGGPSSRNTGNPPSAPAPQIMMPTSSSSPSQISSSNGRRSTDGGVRIAGGPPRTTRGEELGEITDTPTLPPAYRTH